MDIQILFSMRKKKKKKEKHFYMSSAENLTQRFKCYFHTVPLYRYFNHQKYLFPKKADISLQALFIEPMTPSGVSLPNVVSSNPAFQNIWK